MGVWIEIAFDVAVATFALVTPLVGVWIEIALSTLKILPILVTPLVGVWIEICNRYCFSVLALNH